MYIIHCHDRTSDPSRHLEYKDAEYLGTWKSSLRGNNKVTCSSELRDYLDESMPGWRDDHRRRGDEKRSISRNTTSNYLTNPINKIGQNVVISSEMSASLKRKCNDDAEAQNVQKRRNSLHIQLMKAHEVINRCLDRQQRGQHLLPRSIPGHQSAPDLMLEQIDALELGEWKRAVLTQSEEFPWELKSYLDKHLPNWTGDATFHRENTSPTVRTYESNNFQLGTCRGSSTEFGSTSSLRDGQMQPHAANFPIMTNHHPPPPKAESQCHLEEKGVAALLQLSFRAQMTQMPRLSSVGHCAVANVILPPSSIDSIGTNISDQGTKLHENWKKCRSEQDHSGQNNLRSTEVSDVQYSKLCLNRREPPCVEGNQQDDLCSDSAESSIGSKDDNTDAASGSTTTNSDCDSGVRGIDINRQRNEIMINFQDSTSSEGVNRNPIHPWSFLHYQS